VLEFTECRISRHSVNRGIHLAVSPSNRADTHTHRTPAHPRRTAAVPRAGASPPSPALAPAPPRARALHADAGASPPSPAPPHRRGRLLPSTPSQNRRARWKTKQLEKDYDALKRQLDAVKADNDALLSHNKKLQADNDALLPSTTAATGRSPTAAATGKGRAATSSIAEVCC